MRIVCPSCAAAYEVPDARLLPGQPVRCAQCGTNWTPVAPQPAARPVPPQPSPTARPLPSPPSGPGMSDAPVFAASPFAASFDGPRAGLAGGAAVLAGWVVSIAAVIGMGWAAVTWRQDIMHAWPPSERLYSSLGLMAGR